jgi:PEP-CTERM motif-containing protein
LLSIRFSLSLLVGLFLASSGSAISINYDLTGSFMATSNAACAPCTVPVTGTMTIDDDGAGNVSITALNAAHVAYQVASPSIGLDIQLTRTSITLGAGSVAAAFGGSTTTAAAFGGTTLNQVGSITCADTGGPVINCTLAGFPLGGGTAPLPPTQAVASMGAFTFDAFSNFSCAIPCITYNATGGANPSSEFLVLNGTVVPEPTTAVLFGLGLLGMTLRRRV